MAEKFLKQYEILLLKAKEDFVAAKYLVDAQLRGKYEVTVQ